MFIKEIKKNEIKVAIPLTKGTEKTRIKRRSILNEYGIPVSTKIEPFAQDCYVEWQIGYDVIKTDAEKLEKTTLKDFSFIGANGKEKTLYELSEYIKYFYDWKVISKESLINIENYLKQLSEDNFLDTNPELSIKRTHPINKTINDFNFMWTKVEYPLLVYKFGKFEIVAEIKITEKQQAEAQLKNVTVTVRLLDLALLVGLLPRRMTQQLKTHTQEFLLRLIITDEITQKLADMLESYRRRQKLKTVLCLEQFQLI